MMKIVELNVVASRPPEWRPTATPTACANLCINNNVHLFVIMFFVSFCVLNVKKDIHALIKILILLRNNFLWIRTFLLMPM